MKKIFGVIIAISLVFMTTAVYAEDVETTVGGNDVVFQGASVGSGVTMTFTPSPTTCMRASTTSQDYTLQSYSFNNLGEETGMIYLACSGDGAVYQDKIDTAAPSDSLVPGSTLAGYVQKK